MQGGFHIRMPFQIPHHPEEFPLLCCRNKSGFCYIKIIKAFTLPAFSMLKNVYTLAINSVINSQVICMSGNLLVPFTKIFICRYFNFCFLPICKCQLFTILQTQNNISLALHRCKESFDSFYINDIKFPKHCVAPALIVIEEADRVSLIKNDVSRKCINQSCCFCYAVCSSLRYP